MKVGRFRRCVVLRPIVACLVVLLSCTVLCVGQCEPSQKFVELVHFTEASALSPEQKQFIRMHLVGNCFDNAHADAITDTAFEVVQSFGFFRARIAPPNIENLDATHSPQPTAVTLDVVTGRKYYLGSLNCVGMNGKPAAQLCSSSLAAGDHGVLDTSKVFEMMRALRRLYVAAGLADVDIERRVKIEGSRADVWITAIKAPKG